MWLLWTLQQITQHIFLECLHPGTENSPRIENIAIVRKGFVNVFKIKVL